MSISLYKIDILCLAWCANTKLGVQAEDTSFCTHIDSMSELFQIDRTHAKAYLVINCEYDSERQVLDEIRTLPEIKEATLTISRHDILVIIQTSSADELIDIISYKIRTIPKIQCTTTLVCTTQAA